MTNGKRKIMNADKKSKIVYCLLSSVMNNHFTKIYCNKMSKEKQ